MMKAIWWLGLLWGSLFLLAIPLAAQDDAGDGAQFGPDLQWSLAIASQDNRQYDDAASLLYAFAETNPDNEHALDAWMRTYSIYRNNRPNEERKKDAFNKAVAACVQWTTKYATSNKERAAAGLWNHAMLLDYESQRPLAITQLQTLIEKFVDTSYNDDAYWYLAEWMREAKRYPEAITYYQKYRDVVGITEIGGLAWYREGNCKEDLGDPAGAIEAYQHVLEGKYDWRWGQIHWNGLDTARRLKALGKDEMSRAFALKIIDNGSPDWDVVKQAKIFIGAGGDLKKIYIYPHIRYSYTTSNVSINARSKLALSIDQPLLVRMSYVSKDNPFRATLKVTPKVKLAKTPDNMTATETGGVKSYTAEIIAPDDKGNVQQDWWYGFGPEDQTSPPPDGLVVTRTWEKTGANWGECTLRIQSPDRWTIWVYLPKSTSPNNMSLQPNEVHDNNTTFRWHDWFDLRQGLTIKFPVEVEGNVQEFYPRIRLEQGADNRYPGADNSGTTATYSTAEYDITLTSEEKFPYAVYFPGSRTVELQQVTK